MAEEKKIATGLIGNALRSSAADHTTTFTDEIFDTERQKYQNEVNTGLETTDNEIKADLEAEKAAIMGTNRIADGAVTIEKIADSAIDDEPTVGSDNLVKSGGVADKLAELENKLDNITGIDVEEIVTTEEVNPSNYTQLNHTIQQGTALAIEVVENYVSTINCYGKTSEDGEYFILFERKNKGDIVNITAEKDINFVKLTTTSSGGSNYTKTVKITYEIYGSLDDLQKSITDNDNRLSVIENLSDGTSELIYDRSNLVKDGYGINAKDGTLSAFEGWKASDYLEIYDNLELYINNNATSFGLAFYSERTEDSYISGIIYKNQNGKQYVPSNAKYIRFGYPTSVYYTIKIKTYTSASAEVPKIVTIVKGLYDNNIKNDIKLLAIGNSFSRDAFSYVPFVLKSIFENLNITIGIIYAGSASLGTHLNAMNNNTNMTYNKCVNGGAWTQETKTEEEILNDEKWDIITLQQDSDNAANYDTYSPYINVIINYIFNHIDYSTKICWLMTHVKPTAYPSVSEFYTNMVETIKKVYNNYAIEYIFPCGTAIENARTTSLDSLGDYSEGGHLVYSDGQHLQEGIPCLIEAYTASLSILKLMGYSYKSIIACPLEVSEQFSEEKNIPERNGTSVGGDVKSNYLLAQKCAIMAIKNPYETTKIIN